MEFGVWHLDVGVWSFMKPRLDPLEFELSINRRAFLGRAAYGLGGLALASLLEPKLLRATETPAASARWNGTVNPTHFPMKARRVIHLCMAGGPSHLESFDFKPKLKELHGQPFPDSFTQGQQLAQLQNTKLVARGPFCEFRKWGQAGQEISTLFPNIGSVADDLCIVRSLHTEQINHDPAHAFMNTGTQIKGRPSMGSWLLYGLGAETDDLPGFVVLTSAGKSGLQPVSARQWSSGFLPTKFDGILFQSKGAAVHYVGNPEGVCQSTQRQVVEEIKRLNDRLAQERVDPEIQTRISQYEMAFCMLFSGPRLSSHRRDGQCGERNSGLIPRVTRECRQRHRSSCRSCASASSAASNTAGWLDASHPTTGNRPNQSGSRRNRACRTPARNGRPRPARRARRDR